MHRTRRRPTYRHSAPPLQCATCVFYCRFCGTGNRGQESPNDCGRTTALCAHSIPHLDLHRSGGEEQRYREVCGAGGHQPIAGGERHDDVDICILVTGIQACGFVRLSTSVAADAQETARAVEDQTTWPICGSGGRPRGFFLFEPQGELKSAEHNGDVQLRISLKPFWMYFRGECAQSCRSIKGSHAYACSRNHPGARGCAHGANVPRTTM
jgi:hypothetical protein